MIVKLVLFGAAQNLPAFDGGSGRANHKEELLKMMLKRTASRGITLLENRRPLVLPPLSKPRGAHRRAFSSQNLLISKNSHSARNFEHIFLRDWQPAQKGR